MGKGEILDSIVQIQIFRFYGDYSDRYEMRYNILFEKKDSEESLTLSLKNVDPLNLPKIITVLSLNEFEVLS